MSRENWKQVCARTANRSARSRKISWSFGEGRTVAILGREEALMGHPIGSNIQRGHVHTSTHFASCGRGSRGPARVHAPFGHATPEVQGDRLEPGRRRSRVGCKPRDIPRNGRGAAGNEPSGTRLRRRRLRPAWHKAQLSQQGEPVPITAEILDLAVLGHAHAERRVRVVEVSWRATMKWKQGR